MTLPRRSGAASGPRRTASAFVDQGPMRDDEEDAVPPRSAADLTAGKAVIRLPGASDRTLAGP
ncbi:hypothetical protein ADK57_32765 [Streptomyces sp. MMG1533]|nr:hypothetical protein ADK57_32765 [Streptomyces sp. MMG1533]